MGQRTFRGALTYWPSGILSAKPQAGCGGVADFLGGSAPGRNRTCDQRFRKPLLYPLSYEGVVVDSQFTVLGLRRNLPGVIYPWFRGKMGARAAKEGWGRFMASRTASEDRTAEAGARQRGARLGGAVLEIA